MTAKKHLGGCLPDFLFAGGTAFPSQAVCSHFHENLFLFDIHSYGFLEDKALCRFNHVNASAEFWLRFIVEELSYTLQRKCLMPA